jgi:hypothetical protein
MNEEELKKVLEKHNKWTYCKRGGKCAKLIGKNLTKTDLTDTNLTRAIFIGSDLSGSNLYNAELQSADIKLAKLIGTDLTKADLSHACLSDSNLTEAKLKFANLKGADLSGANLKNADLSAANLRNANLEGADLSGANLKNADLTGAILRDAKFDEKEKIRKGICLSRKMIGYKKCEDGVIVKLEIPRGAIVFSINSDKCRTNIAKCVAISSGLNGFVYKLGKTYVITDFNLEYNVECAEGIHFFRTEKEAKKYY